jgi:hypothetical protein
MGINGKLELVCAHKYGYYILKDVWVQLFFQVSCKYFCDNNGFKELY